MIPGFTSEGLLPPGEHPSTWGEVVAALGWNPHRQSQLAGLSAALIPLRTAGCTKVFLDGSFVTSKDLPGDYDAAWDPTRVDLGMLKLIEPVFFDFRHLRAAQKVKYLGEFFSVDGDRSFGGKNLLRVLSKRQKHRVTKRDSGPPTMRHQSHD